MKRVFSLLTSLILLHFLPAQDYEWAHRIGNGNADQGRGIAADANGNVYICGVFSGTIDMDPGAGISNLTSAGGQDIFIAQYSPVGALNWAVRVGGTVNDLPIDLAVDASSNVIVTGVFRGTVDFNPGAGVANTTSSGQEDMFLLKLNSLGAYQWHVAVGGTANDGGHAVATDANDAIYVTGGFEGILIDFNPNGVASTEISFGQENIFIAKYNALGILQWVENIGNTSTDDLGQGIATDNNGDVYVTGWFENIVDFNPGNPGGTIANGGQRDAFLVKFDTGGAFQWVQSVSGATDEEGYGVAVDAEGFPTITGFFNSVTTDFGGTFFSTIGGSDIFVARYSDAGVLQWARQIGNTREQRGNDIAADGCGNVYITGRFSGTLDFDPGIGTANLTAPVPIMFLDQFDQFVARYDRDGNYVWASSSNATTTSAEGVAIALDGCEDLLHMGEFTGTRDLNLSIGVNNFTAVGSSDVFFAKHHLPHTTVFNTNDTGSGSLRNAITCANAYNGPDTVRFCIPGVAPHQIQPLSALPDVTDGETIINAQTQSGFSLGDIILDGTNAGATSGLSFLVANDCAVMGLYVRNFQQSGMSFFASSQFNVLNSVSSANTDHGIRIQSSLNGSIQSSFLGTDPSGTMAMGNGSDGIFIQGGNNHQIGGTGAGEGNVISSNAFGVFLSGNNNVFEGNFIGTDISGTLDLGNATSGIFVSGGTDNVIGGTTAAAGNTIGFNQTGITLDASVTQNTIRLNSIFCNTTAGITLTGAANSSMPVPVIVTPDVSSIFGTAQAGATIDLYLHDTAGCPGAPCQGRTFLGTATADGIGNWVIPGSFGSGGEVTAVATDVNGNSSEFGVCQTVNVLLAPIDITLQASAEGPFTQLRWTISSQEENGTFVIEKAAEGETFTSVANLPLQSEQVQYQFQDAANQNQRLRYRVSLQLPDGHVYQSNQVELTGQGVQSLLVYPNPATTQLDLLLPEAAAWQVQLFNHAGQTVLQQGFSQSAHSLQVDQLPRGMYLIQATATNGDRFQTKVLLQ